MARIRTIKPEFFTSGDIVSLSPLARLLYVALWCEADREGRMRWDPRTFKLRYLPGDTCDIDALCAELVKVGVVKLYGDGLAYIPRFAQHQHINPRESASALPDPSEIDASARVGTRQILDCTYREEGKGREGEEKLSSSAAPTTPADSPGNAKPTQEQRLAQVTDDAIAAFNAKLGKPHGLLPAVSPTVGREKRRGHVRRCLRVASQICREQYGGPAITPDFWRAYFAEVARDPFLSGQQEPGRGHENWRPTFEYLTREDVMLKVFDAATSGVSA